MHTVGIKTANSKEERRARRPRFSLSFAFGYKIYLSLDIFLLFKFLSVKKFKNFKEDLTKSFFLKLDKKNFHHNFLNFYVGP